MTDPLNKFLQDKRAWQRGYMQAAIRDFIHENAAQLITSPEDWEKTNTNLLLREADRCGETIAIRRHYLQEVAKQMLLLDQARQLLPSNTPLLEDLAAEYDRLCRLLHAAKGLHDQAKLEHENTKKMAFQNSSRHIALYDAAVAGLWDFY